MFGGNYRNEDISACHSDAIINILNASALCIKLKNFPGRLRATAMFTLSRLCEQMFTWSTHLVSGMVHKARQTFYRRIFFLLKTWIKFPCSHVRIFLSHVQADDNVFTSLIIQGIFFWHWNVFVFSQSASSLFKRWKSSCFGFFCLRFKSLPSVR